MLTAQFRDLVEAQEGEIKQLKRQLQEGERNLIETQLESEGLRRKLDDVYAQNHNLEDGIGLRDLEFERISGQLREVEREKAELQKLAASEVLLSCVALTHLATTSS
jgi:septal ring factor EnvC (AmiA/AmiB activator)